MGNSEVTIRYAPHLEASHKQLMGHQVTPPHWTLFQALNDVWHKSPYLSGFDLIKPERGFFGVLPSDVTKSYNLENFPSLWDMFGKFMGGMDLHVLWGEVYEDVVHGPEVANRISAHSAMLFDEIETRTLPQFLGGMRDINAIQSSAFMVGKSLLYDTHTKAVNEFATTLRVAQVELSGRLWARHLDWDAQVMTIYGEMFKLYFGIKHENDARQLEYLVKDRLWDIGLFDYARAFIGALNGAAAASDAGKPPIWQQVLSGVMSGAAMAVMAL